MNKRFLSYIAVLFFIISLFPAMAAHAASAARPDSDRLIDDGDICRLFGNAQAVCRQFLDFLESHKPAGQNADGVSVFEWLDENIGGQLQIVHLSPSSGMAKAANRTPIQVHVFVVKDDLSVSSQTEGRDYELFVIVLNENNKPIPGAKIEYVVEYVDHRETHNMPQPTNAEGIVSTHFHVDLLPTYQMVKVGVLVNAAEQQKNAGTAFWGGY